MDRAGQYGLVALALVAVAVLGGLTAARAGGQMTFGDDTNTNIQAKYADKSDYEKSLENQIANTDDPDRKDDLQRQLDRERARGAA